ncbi:MAG: cytidylate kinase-like family protein [Clostridia bacterium]|nr:cytidylate kinase-like family protein [Clostridia bacterium]MBQ6614126.1 cytidylate kinase-like family protein [Clostridia bacterium]
MDKFVITISRGCGSGGVRIGRILAERLGVDYYDSKLLRLASDDSGINEELFVNADEKLKKTSLFKVSRKNYHGEVIPPESSDFTSSRNLFNYQSKVIRELAENENCIIIGRCSEIILKDLPHVFRVFISGSYDKCAAIEANDHGLSMKAAYEKVDKVNKYRADYQLYYTGKEWGHPGNYDLCLSTDNFTLEQCADIIINAAKIKLENKK